MNLLIILCLFGYDGMMNRMQTAVFRSDRVESAWSYARPWELLRNLLQNRELLRQFTVRAIYGRYRASYLGIFWAVLTPLMQLGVYTLVFSVIMQVGGDRFEGHMGYALFLFSGLIVFNVFGEVATEAPRLVVNQPNLVKKVVFPLELLPVSQVGAAVFHSLLSLVILLGAMLVTGGSLPWTIVYIPLIFVPLVILSVGVGWFLSSLGVFLRDIGNAIAIIVQLLFFLTPVLYPVQQVPDGLRELIWLNPMASIVEDFRLVVREGLSPDWLRLAAVTVVSCVIALAGYVWFMKIKRAFADAL